MYIEIWRPTRAVNKVIHNNTKWNSKEKLKKLPKKS